MGNRMKNRELADFLFDKMTEYLESSPNGEVLVRVSSAAGKSPRELLPAFVEVMDDWPNIIRVDYINTIVGEAYDFRKKGIDLNPEKIFRDKLALDKVRAFSSQIVFYGEEANGKAFLIKDLSLDQSY